MKNLKILFMIISLLSAVGIVACGSGDGSSSNGTTSIRSVGTITGFGSVYVGQTRFDTGGATILRDGDRVSEDDLRVGMVVEVYGTYDDGDCQADTIDYDKTLKGPIDSITLLDPETKELEILGKRVIVGKGKTKFEDTSFDDLAVDMYVEASGHIYSSGALMATYLEKDSDDFDSDEDEIEIEGYVAVPNKDAKTFELDSYLIDYSQAEFDDLSPDDLKEGLFVEVEGMLENAGTIKAFEIESDDQDCDDGDEVEVEGYIQEVFSKTEFKVNGFYVQITENTELDDGTLDNIQVDARVEVEGRMEENILMAYEVGFEYDD